MKTNIKMLNNSVNQLNNAILNVPVTLTDNYVQNLSIYLDNLVQNLQ